MILRRTPAGLSHGEAPAGEPFLLLRLKPGWQLDPDGNVVRSAQAGKGRRAQPASPSPLALIHGARFVPAILLSSSQRGQVTAAEAELARFVQLRLPTDAALDEWLALARSWEFVESVQIPPPVAELP